MPSPPRPAPCYRRSSRPAGLLLAVALLCAGPLAAAAAPLPAAEAAAEAFLRPYWETPIPLQGPAPEGYAAPARSIAPEQCGLCHYQQYLDWRESWHARALGPGLLGQFARMTPAQQTGCQRCHAPLGEQWPVLPGKTAPNAAYDAALREEGLVCAACHLRRHRRHGPPADPARVAAGTAGASALLHGAPVRTPHFRASAFCQACHQHPATAVQVNGKPIENTYGEWLASPAAARGQTCQTCHMPGGRHLWRGIHDAELTRAGVTVQATVAPDAPRVGTALRARLTLENTGVGHAFPTYTTPAVYLRAALLDAAGKVLPGTFAEQVLQRRLNLGTSPWSEDFDTRVLPGQRATLRYERTVPPGAVALYLWVWVEPDHFYTGFYRSLLARGGERPGADALREALRRSLASPYRLFGRRIPVRPAR